MNQNQALLKYLKRNRSGITQWTAAFDLGILRLSERIRELESEGHTIHRHRERGENRYGNPVSVVKYKLI